MNQRWRNSDPAIQTGQRPVWPCVRRDRAGRTRQRAERRRQSGRWPYPAAVHRRREERHPRCRAERRPRRLSRRGRPRGHRGWLLPQQGPNDLAFQIAGSLAFKDAVAKARPVLPEPIMPVECTTPPDYQGDLVGDLHRRRGMVREVAAKAGAAVVSRTFHSPKCLDTRTPSVRYPRPRRVFDGALVLRDRALRTRRQSPREAVSTQNGPENPSPARFNFCAQSRRSVAARACNSLPTLRSSLFPCVSSEARTRAISVLVG